MSKLHTGFHNLQNSLCQSCGTQRIATCEACIRAGVHPIYMGVYSLNMSPLPSSSPAFSSPMSSSASYSSQTVSDGSSNSDSSHTLLRSPSPSSDSTRDTYSRSDNIMVPVTEVPEDYTPSTIHDSLGHTPPPMQTPPNISFTDQLAYIDKKLLDYVSSHTENLSPYNSPRFPPGLTLEYQHSNVSSSQIDAAKELERQFITYPQTRNPSGVRRTHSKMTRDELECRSLDPNASSSIGSGDWLEQDTKRRKLRQHDSATSTHVFIAKEPASLRKASSLIAGDVNVISQPPDFTCVPIPKFSPIVVPTISPHDAALARLHALLERESAQRADDTRLISVAQKPASLGFDNELHTEMVEWMLAVKAPAGDVCKPLRRHLRVSYETRFHAVWLFSRYVIRLSNSNFNPFLIPRNGKEDPYHHRIREKLAREVALGCLAISCKFHHDFLPPLLPLTVEQFLDMLGDNHPISFDDFELVQNAILKSFSYIIYQPIPQAYLQEIWKVCPTLHIIKDGDCEAHRTDLIGHALELIETCLLEAMSYPVSYLAAGALLEALHILEIHQQCTRHSEGQRWDPRGEGSDEVALNTRVCVACVSKEICATMRIAPNALHNCRDWIMATWVGELAE